MRPAAPSIRPHREAAGLQGGAEADELLARLFDQGRGAFPALAVDQAAFVRLVARHTPDPAAPLEHLAALHAADLYLACACVERAKGAVEAFSTAYGATIDAALRGLGASPAQRDELRQALFEKLFVGRPGAPPKIGDYAGRGPLGGWVRVAAVRTGRNGLRQAKVDRLADPGAFEAADRPGGPDPELAFLKVHYRDEVRRALKEALAGLALDERNVLRLSFLDGLTIDELASVYGVHRATAARWVVRGRSALLRHTHALLGQRLRAVPSEVEAIIDLVRSQLDVTFQSLFRVEPPPEPPESPAPAPTTPAPKPPASAPRPASDAR
jgi:RNA polymerase sigma-70 factor, ECF subfamily